MALAGKVSGAGTNIGLAGARIEVFTIDPHTGERLGPALYTAVVPAGGDWVPLASGPGARHEFVVSAPGYATTHFHRSPFARSTTVLHLRPERVPEADRNAPSLALMTRPRGYLDPGRDRMAFDGQSPPPVALLGTRVAVSRIKPVGLPRTLVAEFNGEGVVGRSWLLDDNHVSVLELSY